jgi:diguanylate cyclase (GGDEF)-like protein
MLAQDPVPRASRISQLWIYADRDAIRIAAFVLLAALIAAVGVLVHLTGGIKYVYSHAMYLPVVLAGAMFRTFGGVLAGVAGGLVLGPWMPIDTASGELQEPFNWLYRMFFFCLIGALSGFLFAAMREHVARIQWLSEHDVHTGLPNRMYLERALRAELGGESLAPGFLVIVVNVENYLEIINTLGPDVGKPLMGAIYERVASCLPETALLCQYHTDRFVAVRGSDDAAQVARDITLAMRRSFEVADIHVYVDASIGMARFPLHGHECEELIQKASIAMHASMKQGLPWSTYDHRLDQTNRETLTLLGLIPAAIAAGEFRLHCQPKLRLSDGSCSGAEVLMRWQHPLRGDIPPASFIPHAERTSLIHLLTRWVIEEAFGHLARWVADIPDIQVAINLTARDLGDPDLPRFIDAQARKHALDPANIEFEITETGILADQQSAAQLLQVIKSYGFRIAVDDFGTGQSSLQYLKNLPIDSLKIDQGFVRNLLHDVQDQSIVKTVIAMAHSLGMEVTAEGVEDAAVLEYLAALGCTHAQGYAIARPFPAEQLTAWIGERATRR